MPCPCALRSNTRRAAGSDPARMLAVYGDLTLRNRGGYGVRAAFFIPPENSITSTHSERGPVRRSGANSSFSARPWPTQSPTPVRSTFRGRALPTAVAPPLVIRRLGPGLWTASDRTRRHRWAIRPSPLSTSRSTRASGRPSRSDGTDQSGTSPPAFLFGPKRSVGDKATAASDCRGSFSHEP